MYEHLSNKYKFLLVSLASISLPFFEFINFNFNNLGPPEFKTLAYTIIFFISFLFLFSLIVSILFDKDFFEIFFLCSITIYIIFNYDKIKLLIINLSSKITSFSFQGELSLILIFVIITVFLFFFIKKSSSFLNFIYIYIIVLFIINMTNFIFIQKNKNEITYQTLFSNEAYFTEDEINKMKGRKSFDFSIVKEVGTIGKYKIFSY